MGERDERERGEPKRSEEGKKSKNIKREGKDTYNVEFAIIRVSLNYIDGNFYNFICVTHFVFSPCHIFQLFHH